MGYILGVSDQHDSGACIINEKGHILSAINEERVSRIKLPTKMPFLAIKEAIKIAGIKSNEITNVALSSHDWSIAHLTKTGKMEDAQEDYWKKSRFSSMMCNDYLRKGLDLIRLKRAFAYAGMISRPGKNDLKKFLEKNDCNAKIKVVDHHYGHAAGAYFTNNIDNNLIITIDAGGDGFSGGIYTGNNGKIETIYRLPWPHTPAYLYARITQLLGYRQSRHEGKVLGLAAFGNPNICYKKIKKLIKYSKGTFISDTSLGWGYPGLIRLKSMFSKDKKENVAAALQKVCEEIIVDYIRYYIKITGKKNVTLAGGFFANVRVNQKIIEETGAENIFIHPHMGDGGLAVGSALAIAANIKKIKQTPLNNVYFGTGYSNEDIKKAINKAGYKIEKVPDIENHIAAWINNHKIIGCFQGRMEYGPRALGNRTIIANPTDKKINDWLNKRLKRTEFMPFAPSCIDTDAKTLYKNYKKAKYASKFMTITFDVEHDWNEKAPAVSHIDHTARPQIVDEKTNKRYYQILKAHKDISGLPLFINTSFNMHEEPIVQSPSDAIRSFNAGAVDILVLGDYFIKKT